MHVLNTLCFKAAFLCVTSSVMKLTLHKKVASNSHKSACLCLPWSLRSLIISIYLCSCLSTYVSMNLSLYLSVCLYIPLSIRLILYLFIFCFFKTRFLSSFGACPLELEKKQCITTTTQLDVFFLWWAMRPINFLKGCIHCVPGIL